MSARALSRVAAVSALFALFGILGRTARAQLIFNLEDPSNLQTNNPTVYNDFVTAANRWSSIFNNPITVNLQIGYASLGAGILGSTDVTSSNYSYSSTATALKSNATSADQISAGNHLQSGSSFSMLINRTNNNPNGVGSATPYLENTAKANNSTMYIANAEAKALGMYTGSAGALDASITFSSNFNFFFNPNQPAANEFDFVGVATHEIGHALGFDSGVDVLDENSPNGSTYFNDYLFTYVTPLDLFRFSSTSLQNGAGVIDWTDSSSQKYFSVDGGATNIADFADGYYHGDAAQASHWKEGENDGIMNPSAHPDTTMAISADDVRAFNVLGYNLASAATPEPSAWLTFGVAGAGLAGLRIRARRRVV